MGETEEDPQALQGEEKAKTKQKEKEQKEQKSTATVDTYTKKVDVILPPPELRVIIDRTADFVRKVGVAFEKEIAARNSKTKKFNFLKPDNPFHAYYQRRLTYGDKAIEDDADLAAPETIKAAQVAAEQKVKEEQERQIKEAEEKLKKKAKKKAKTITLKEKLTSLIRSVRTVKSTPAGPPAADKYSISYPSFSAVDIDIIRLTALFVATNGRSFLAGLTAREQRNPQFEFLRPNHSLFHFFQQLVDAYAQIIYSPKKLCAEIQQKLEDSSKFMEEALSRAKHRKMQRDQEEKNKQNEEDERVAMALIDWRSFVVVETINFTQEEEPFLPRPRETIEEMNALFNAQEVDPRLAQEPLDIDMEMDMDMDMDEDDEDKDAEEEEEAKEDQKKKKKKGKGKEKDRDDKEDIEKDAFEPEPEPEVVVGQDAVKKIVDSGKSVMVQKCKVCGEFIPIEDIQEHMRIELLDPKWKEQKQKMGEKQRESSLAASTSIADNLTRLARKRQDVFVGTHEAEQEKAYEKEDERAQSIWDVHKEKQRAAAIKAKEDEAKKTQASSSTNASSLPPTKTTTTSASLQTPQVPQIPQTSQVPRPPPATPPPARPTPPVPVTPIVPRPTPTAFPTPPPTLPPSQIPMMGVPPMPMPMALPGLVPQMAPLRPEEPSSKKPKTNNLLSEEEMLMNHPGPIGIKVVIPVDESKAEWNFNGQTLDLVLNPTDTVTDVKNKLSEMLNQMPATKMKLNFFNGAFLNKDTMSLAAYNIRPGTILQLGVRERGGRVKK